MCIRDRFKPGDLAIVRQDTSELFKSKVRRIVLIKSPAYVLAGKLYYDVISTYDKNCTILREDEIEKF